ncbi:MAG: protocatechuate 3,4-dioxygenase subunit alpha [Terriglobales bacterium]
MTLLATPSQTVGPFFHIGCSKLLMPDLAGEEVAGVRITIEGRILDGDANPVPDAMIEIWQANAFGKYDHPADTQEKPLDPDFKGFGRVATDRNGKFRFTTIKPGSVPGIENTVQAPHLVVSIFMRGLLKRLVTRIYFPGDSENDNDPVLNSVALPRRKTLIARKAEGPEEVLLWDVILQGEDETVFFDV